MDIKNLACTHAGVWPVNQGSCPICFNVLREENDHLRLNVSFDLVTKLTRERDEARAEVKRLEGLILRCDELSEQDYEMGTCNGCDEETAFSDVQHKPDCILIALLAEAKRIRGEK